MQTKKITYLLVFTILYFLIPACNSSNNTAPVSNDSFSFTPLPSSSGLPLNANTVQNWIDTGNDEAIRNHALEIWKALNTSSGQIFQGRELPVWETWYSGDEIYDSQSACSSTQRPSATTNFENPRQLFKHNVADEATSSFNKFDGLYAQNVCDNLYNNPNTLTALNQSFTPSTPIIDRSIQGFALGTTALKPVFMLVSQSGLTSIPYWNGAENSTNFAMPSSNTWTQCVAVDPSPNPHYADLHKTVNQSCNGTNTNQQVVSINQFYHFALSQGDIDNLSGFAPSQELAGAKVGDFAILVAMHVTMKEVPQWVWQTFWWEPNAANTPFPAEERPAKTLNKIPNPFNNYAMCTAYQMVIPEVTGTTPKICFNPYLEPGLTGVVGKESNCMTCHSLATWGNGGPFGGGLDYQTNGYIDQGSSLFSDVTKLDFLWSVTRASDNSSN